MASRGVLKDYRDRFEAMKPGDRITYHPRSNEPRPRGVFAYFMAQSDAGRALLYQERTPVPGHPDVADYSWCAQKLSKRSAAFIQKVAKCAV